MYTGVSEPTLFAYASSDASVANISARGLLTARNIGLTILTATSAGVTSEPLPVIVGAPLTSIRFTSMPATLQVGDTATVRIDALDAAGQVVVGAQIWYELTRPQDSVATVVLGPRRITPAGGTYATPLIVRVRALKLGTATIAVSVPHTVVARQPVLTASASLLVTTRSSPTVLPPNEP